MPQFSGRYPSGQRGQTVNLLANAFRGSNPLLPTTVGFADETVGFADETAGTRTRRTGRGNSSAVERQPSKLGVAGSNPVSRSIVTERRSAARVEGGLSEMRVAALADARGLSERRVAAPADIPRDVAARRIDNVFAHVAQLAEHALGKGEVSGSIPDMGSIHLRR